MNIKWELRKARANAARRTAYFVRHQDRIRERALRREEAVRKEEARDFVKWAKKPLSRLERKEQSVGLVQQAKQRPCCDCGGCFHPDAMEFHHRDESTKDFALNRAKSYGLDRVIKEITKCDLLCANCHRTRHARLRAGLPATMPPPDYEI